MREGKQMRAALVRQVDGAVVNVIEVDADSAYTPAEPDLDVVPCSDEVEIGARWLEGAFVPPDPEPPSVAAEAVPQRISFRQLVLGLLGCGFLTAEQALAAAETRARPPQLDGIIATLPPDAALAARITWAAMSEARRADPLFAALIAAGHATAEQVDDLFREAVAL